MKQFRANQGEFGQNKARLGQSKCGFATLQTHINTGGEGLTTPKSKSFIIMTDTSELILHRGYQLQDLIIKNKLFF